MDASADKPHILVVDDDTRLRELLKTFLSRNGFRVTTAGNAAEAGQRLASLDFDLIVLDVMMPGQTGLDFVGELRLTDDVPILMLTAMGESKDRIAGLEKGVDDYLAKPFEVRELLLRIQSVLRRNRPASEPGAEPARQATFGPYQFDLELGELTQKGKRMPLTDAEVGLLRALAVRLGEVLSRETLSKSMGAAVNERAIDVQVNSSAPQDRARSGFPALPADRPRPGLSAGRRMIAAARDLFERIARFADRHSPQTLFARALIIIVVPMLLLQALSALWFYSQRGDNVTNRLAQLLVRDLDLLITLRSDFPDEAHRAWILRRAAQDLLLYVSFRQGYVRPFLKPEYFDIAAREVEGALNADLKRNYYIDNNVGGGQMLIEIQLSDAEVMDVLVPYVRLTFGSSFAYVLAQVGLGLVLFGLAIWFMRRELVPIEHLGVAADALGKGRDVPDFAFSGGTREVRNAATAFQTMGIRLRRSIQQRTEMLAGVSHDLRTPLTRMKLSLALLPDSPETKELGDDVVDMERMIEGYLAFARGEGDEDPAPVDLAEILEEVAAGARRDNANVEVGWQGEMDVELRALAIKRCLTNLVSNALRYGTKVRLQAIRGRTSVEITIDDDGPGIPPDKYEDVFRPFFRLDESRNVDTGGVGLGLTIARDVARSHGGDVALAPSPLGGLRVVVRIPI